MTVAAVVEHRDVEAEARVDLAAVFRWTARSNMHESVANHFSYAVSPDGRQFLINRAGQHFSTIKASDLILMDAQDPDAAKGLVDPTAISIHGAMHRNAPQARVVLHLHPKYSTALASLEDSSMPPIDATSTSPPTPRVLLNMKRPTSEKPCAGLPCRKLLITDRGVVRFRKKFDMPLRTGPGRTLR